MVDVTASRPGVDDAGGGKLFAPAAGRNAAAVAEALVRLLGDLPGGEVLEIGAGTGQHAVACAAALPRLSWRPTDPDPAHLASIAAWATEAALPNLRAPLQLNVVGEWPAAAPAAPIALYAANVVHIAPWTVAEAIFAGAGARLAPGGRLMLYGPFFDQGDATEGNRAFDRSLRGRDPAWGLRDIRDLDALAARCRLGPAQRTAMPANNLILSFRR
ncbi:MAG: DUF938 domain-containing protein [Pseudomonadota bacterium]